MRRGLLPQLGVKVVAKAVRLPKLGGKGGSCNEGAGLFLPQSSPLLGGTNGGGLWSHIAFCDVTQYCMTFWGLYLVPHGTRGLDMLPYDISVSIWYRITFGGVCLVPHDVFWALPGST